MRGKQGEGGRGHQRAHRDGVEEGRETSWGHLTVSLESRASWDHVTLSLAGT